MRTVTVATDFARPDNSMAHLVVSAGRSGAPRLCGPPGHRWSTGKFKIISFSLGPEFFLVNSEVSFYNQIVFATSVTFQQNFIPPPKRLCSSMPKLLIGWIFFFPTAMRFLGWEPIRRDLRQALLIHSNLTTLGRGHQIKHIGNGLSWKRWQASSAHCFWSLHTPAKRRVVSFTCKKAAIEVFSFYQ